MEDDDGVETLRQDRLRVFLTGLCAQLKGEAAYSHASSIPGCKARHLCWQGVPQMPLRVCTHDIVVSHAGH